MNNTVSDILMEEISETIKKIIKYTKVPNLEISEKEYEELRLNNDILNQYIRRFQTLDTLKTTIDNKNLMIEIEDLLESLKQE